MIVNSMDESSLLKSNKSQFKENFLGINCLQQCSSLFTLHSKLIANNQHSDLINLNHRNS